MDYPVPAHSLQIKLIIKRSRFIASVVPVDNKTVAMDKLSAIRHTYADANHHCWAMVVPSTSGGQW